MWPEHVGVPLGEDSDTLYFIMETHYDNPRLKEGKWHASEPQVIGYLGLLTHVQFQY